MGATVADLEAFIATLRSDREQRSGPGVYASDKVFALLDELDRLRSIELNWQIDTLGGAVEPGRKADIGGWIVGNGAGTAWRVWRDGFPEWTEQRDVATRYARREDAEAVHREDEDAWIVIPYKGQAL